MTKNLLAIVCCLTLCFSSTYAAKLPSSSVPDVSYFTPETPFVAPAPNVKDAFKEFRSVTKAERKDRIKAAKQELKLFKQERKAGNAPSTNTLLLVILAILLPPLAVYLHEGVINGKFWLSLLLTLLFWIPGVIYALIVVLGNG